MVRRQPFLQSPISYLRQRVEIIRGRHKSIDQLPAVTGGAQGLGLVTARALLEHGLSNLAIFDVDEECGNRAVAHLRGTLNDDGDVNRSSSDITFVKVDVTDGKGVEEAVEEVNEVFGGVVDVVVCFAGITGSRLSVEYPVEEWRRIMDVNILGSLLVARAVAK